MIDVLKLLEISDLIPLLQKPDIWNSLDVDYHPPRVERIWTEWNEYRIYLHCIHTCEKEEALYHSHPWPSAMKIISGIYEMGVGFKTPENVNIKTCATVILNSGTYYEMLNKEGFHYVRPLTKCTFTIMVTGKPWDSDSSPKPSKKLEKLSDERKEFIRNKILSFYI